MSSEPHPDASLPDNPTADAGFEGGSEIAALDKQHAIVAADPDPNNRSSDKKEKGAAAESAEANDVTKAIVAVEEKMENQQQQQQEGTLLAAAMKKHAALPRSSRYHGVTRLKWSGKYEAHLWDNTSKVEGRKRKGKHVYLGSYVKEEQAARGHDLAALKYWGPGPSTKLNFTVSEYEKELEIMKTMSHDEFVAYIRRQSSCFSRGTSSYRGVTRRKDGKWQARIGRIADSRETKDIYLGTFETEEEAAEAYDIAAIELRGVHAVTNFDINTYNEDAPKKLEEGPLEALLQLEGPSESLSLASQ